jgi:hypothetical protein
MEMRTNTKVRSRERRNANGIVGSFVKSL